MHGIISQELGWILALFGALWHFITSHEISLHVLQKQWYSKLLVINLESMSQYAVDILHCAFRLLELSNFASLTSKHSFAPFACRATCSDV